MILRSFFPLLAFQSFHAADDGAAAAGGAAPTLKQQLETAQATIKSLELDKTAIQGKLDISNGKVSALEGEKTGLTNQVNQLNADLSSANSKVTILEGEKVQLNAEIAKLKGESKTAETRAEEKGAAHGIKPLAKPPQAGAGTSDDVALYEQYSKMKGRERGAFFRAHQKELMAYEARLRRENNG